MSNAGTKRGARAADWQDAAVEISRLFREAKVDAPLRVKALAALALAAGSGSVPPLRGLAQVNRRVGAVLAEAQLPATVERGLRAALRLDAAHFGSMAGHVERIAAVLGEREVPLGWRSGFDLFAWFYEAFLRYGYDNNSLGIVFTPRHIARFCVDLIGVNCQDRVLDLACGTGGFLVAARQSALRRTSETPGEAEGGLPERAGKATGPVLAGFDTNRTVWALAVLNTMLGAGGRADIRLGNCLDAANRRAVRHGFTRAFLNPPFSQGAEPERDFIDATMAALRPGGRCAVLVAAGIFADEEHAAWRLNFLRRHTVLGVIAVPDDVFYPTAAPAAILLAEAHRPQPAQAPVMLARVANDGYEKLKNRRVERDGCELPEVTDCFHQSLERRPFRSRLAATVTGAQLQHGAEWSPHEWLPPRPVEEASSEGGQNEALASILRAVADRPELAGVVLPDFCAEWATLPVLPAGRLGRLKEFFQVVNGRSAGEKQHSDGPIPYVSSGGLTNSIVRLVQGQAEAIFTAGGITVTAFGQAAVQPWPFLARGNGGSSVRVLLPRFAIDAAELLWFAEQINAQQWRFFYARMAIKSRLERLLVSSPKSPLPPLRPSIAERVREFERGLSKLSTL